MSWGKCSGHSAELLDDMTEDKSTDRHCFLLTIVKNIGRIQRLRNRKIWLSETNVTCNKKLKGSRQSCSKGHNKYRGYKVQRKVSCK